MIRIDRRVTEIARAREEREGRGTPSSINQLVGKAAASSRQWDAVPREGFRRLFVRLYVCLYVRHLPSA